MAYFSRLTDIVTCNLTVILAGCENAEVALAEIMEEMKEGVAGAERSLQTSISNVVRLQDEIASNRLEIAQWLTKAQESLKSNQDEQARVCLERKHEIEDLIGGLEQQLHAAISTRDHLRTMLNAILARRAEADRKLLSLKSGEESGLLSATKNAGQTLDATSQTTRLNRIDSELEELRRQLKS